MTSFYDPYEPVRKPADYSTDDATLEEEKSPHETAAVLRMHRAGWPAPRIMEAFGISKETLMLNIRLAMEDETEAHRTGRAIHDALIKKGTV